MDKQNNKCNKLSTDGMLAMKTEYFNRIASIDYEMYSKNEEGPINPKECAFFEELKSDERITGLKAENDCTYYTIIGKAKEIDICLQLGLYGTALTSAITLPDTCGLIMKCRESTGSVRDRYEKWFEEYVLTNSSPSCDSLKKVDFTGKRCYQLRNKILHQNTICEYEDNCNFNLTLSDTIEKIDCGNITKITIGIPFLCDAILDGFEKFIRTDYPAPLDYKTFGFKVYSTAASIEAKKAKCTNDC